MKKLYQILIFIVITYSFCFNAQAQWKRMPITPSFYPTGALLDVFILKTNTKLGWACGHNSQVLRTTDGGFTWNAATVPGTSLQFEHIMFLNERTGYVSGGNAIFRSDDGGLSWRDITPIDNNGTQIWGNYFYDVNNGVCLGGGCEGTINFYKTTNGGATWRVFRSAVSPPSGASDAIIYDPNGLGYAVTSGLLWRTNNGGVTWEIFARTEPGSFSYNWQEDIEHKGNSFLLPYAQGCSGETGRVIGGLRFSTDNGTTWRNFSTGYSMFGTFLVNDSTGWGVGFERTVYYTTNRGETWELRNCGIEPGDDLDDITWIDTVGFVVGALGIYRSAGLEQEAPNIEADRITACEGDTVTIKSDKYYFYTRWSTGDNTNYITVTESGTYWLYAYNTECDSLRYSDTITVTFKPKPDLTLDKRLPSVICEGDTVILTAVSSAEKVRWSPRGDTTRTIKVTESGVYIIEAINGEGCKISDSVLVNFAPAINPIITAIGDTSFCKGGFIRLNIDRQYSKIYWYKDNDVIEEDKTSIDVTESGSYYAEAVSAEGCKGKSNIINVLVKNDSNKFEIDFEANSRIDYQNVIYPDRVCKDAVIRNKTEDTLTLNDPFMSIGVAFSIPASQLPLIFAPKEEKAVKVCYSPTKLTEQRDTINIADICSMHKIPVVAVGEGAVYLQESPCFNEIVIKVVDIAAGYDFTASDPYPNPSDDFLTLSFKSKTPATDAVLYDLLGSTRLIGKINYDERDKEGSIVFNVSALPSGLYYIEIRNADKLIVKKALISN